MVWRCFLLLIQDFQRLLLDIKQGKTLSRKLETFIYSQAGIEHDGIIKSFGDISYLLWGGLSDGTVLLEDKSIKDTVMQLPEDEVDHTKLHRHDYIEIGYVQYGQFTQYIVDEYVTFNEGDVFLIDKNTRHYDILKGADHIVIFLKLSSSYFDQVFLNKMRESSLKAFLIEAINGDKLSRQYLVFKSSEQSKNIDELFKAIVGELNNEAQGYEYVIKGYLIRLMHILAFSYKNQLTKINRRRMEHLIFQQVTDYMRDHYADIHIEDLENQFHYNTDYYNRLIKKYANMTYKDYLIDIRIGKAKELLKYTSMTITDIIQEVGYCNKGYFYRTFEKRQGLKPSQYRQQYRAKNKKVPE